MSEDHPVMNNGQLQTWLAIALDMGLQVDEAGHPYRQGAAYVLDGETYHHLHDFNPLHDPADAFRVQLHFGLSLEVEQDVIVVREGFGPIVMCDVVHCKTPEGRVAAGCEAVFHSAGKLLARRELMVRAGAD